MNPSVPVAFFIFNRPLPTQRVFDEIKKLRPAILLITDPYSRDWRAVPLAGSSQQSYEILPADYILRAIPLAAGHHHLLVEYAPPSFRTGRAISLAAFVLWIGAAAGLQLGGRRRPTAV